MGVPLMRTKTWAYASGAFFGGIAGAFYAAFKSSPLVDWAAGGYLYITGLPGREPLAGPAALPAYVTGYVAASAVEVGLRLRAQGIDVSGAPGDKLDGFVRQEMARWTKVVKDNNIKSGD